MKIRLVAFCVSELRRFSESCCSTRKRKVRWVGGLRPRLRKITFVGDRAPDEGRRPTPDPFCDANFIRIARSSPRYEFLRSPRLSLTDVRLQAEYLDTSMRLAGTDNRSLKAGMASKVSYTIVRISSCRIKGL